ncbi:MAG: DNA-binding LytR/AlgR family response regulator [Flavobacteriaceae bacterium]|jgi:DNA-binding LytR/AlgR family response regulator
MYVYLIENRMKRISNILFAFVFITSFNLLAQEQNSIGIYFNLKGSVIEAETNLPISRVNIEIDGGNYTTTNNLGEFSLSAKVGDELILRSDDFRTIYYTITDKQKITLKFENIEEIPELRSKRSKSTDVFRSYIDSAKTFTKKDAEKSIEYVTKALESVPGKSATNAQNSIAFETLIEAVDYVSEIKAKENSLQNTVLKPKFTQVDVKITIPLQNGFEVLEIKDIFYCQADDNYTNVFINEKKKLVSKTLKYFDEILSKSGFARVHKSYLVNVNAIIEYIKGKGGSIVLSSGKEIIVSPSRKKELLAFFN